MAESVNLRSQQISFVNKITVIYKATSDDESPTPSYLYKEISDISFESIGYSESLVEFLLDRLKNKSCHVKLKVLKVMKHVTDNGSKEFQLGLRASADTIREFAKFSGPPHPLHGNVPYAMIRKTAKELCEKLYNLDPLNLKGPSASDPVSHNTDSKYGGLGPSRSGGAIQGFGNTSPSQHKGLGETILEGIEKLGSKISETPADRQAAVLSKLNLSGSSSNYQPPVVSPGQEPHCHPPTHSHATQDVQAVIKKPVSRHLPGKAGGGWNDDDDDDDDEDAPDTISLENSDKMYSRSIETDSLADVNNQGDVQADWCPEVTLVDEFMIRDAVSLGKQASFVPLSKVNEFIIKCSTVNCDNVVRLLDQKLSTHNPYMIARALQALEGLIYNEEELINIDLLAIICKSSLVDCFHHCGSQVKLDTDNQMNVDNVRIWKQVQMKAAKIILILQQLSSHKEILGHCDIVKICPSFQLKTEA